MSGTTVSRFHASFATVCRDDTRRVLKEGDPLPSVRNGAAEYRVDHLTVLKGYQQLVDEQLVERDAGTRNLLLGGQTPKVSCGRMAQGLFLCYA